MKTDFTDEQLHTPLLKDADGILRKCVHCGLCTATCPTYVLLRDERDSPRGRIYLIKEMFETGGRVDKTTRLHVDRCLSCLSCMTTCPGGVDYMHLVDMARAHIEKNSRRPLKQRLLRRVLAKLITDPKRFRLALIAAIPGRLFTRLFDLVGLKELSAMLALGPRGLPKKGVYTGSGVFPAADKRKKRIALIPGCAQQVLRPGINDATIRLLTRHGVEVVIPDGVGCCGSLEHHLGMEEAANQAAMRNVDALSRVGGDEPLDAVIINASGCGTTVKDYGHMLRHEEGYAERAGDIARHAVDVSEFLAGLDLSAPAHWSGLRVAYHSACSMQHGQKVNDEPRALLRQVGFEVVEIPEGHLCCGSAGTYNILQPKIAGDLLARKVKNIESVRPDVIATGNIGCISQIATGTKIPVVHTVELLDWALGGECPRELHPLLPKVKSVRTMLTEAAE